MFLAIVARFIRRGDFMLGWVMITLSAARLLGRYNDVFVRSSLGSSSSLSVLRTLHSAGLNAGDGFMARGRKRASGPP